MANNTARHLNFHYGNLSLSTQRLSSGLRINGAADDAAGLAIRELMRAEVAALNQGVRNVNDAISLIQTADGALATIDEQLIRMKQLTEQAATGTYNSVQRLMIESEYQTLAKEITRIANATDFNGIKLLDGTFDPNTSNKMGDLTFEEMNAIATQTINYTGPPLFTYDTAIGQYVMNATTYNTVLAGARGANMHKQAHVGNLSARDSILAESQNDSALIINALNSIIPGHRQYNDVTTEQVAGLARGAEVLTVVTFTGGGDVTVAEINNALTAMATAEPKDGMIIHFGSMNDSAEDYYQIDIGTATARALGVGDETFYNGCQSIKTQETAGQALEALDKAIISKDKIRAHLGAMQNRLESTADNLIIQAENTLASESQISDTNVAYEMTNFVRNQILSQSAVAMLSQANNLPKMVMTLVNG